MFKFSKNFKPFLHSITLQRCNFKLFSTDKLRKSYDIDTFPETYALSKEIIHNLGGKLINHQTDYIDSAIIQYEFTNPQKKVEIFIHDPWDLVIESTDKEIFDKIITQLEEKNSQKQKTKKKI